MDAEKFRELALKLPEAVESSHMGHPDFRVGGKIFATIGPTWEWGMVKLSPEQQASFLQTGPDAFRPAAGAWGRNGSTLLTFSRAEIETVRLALDLAWRNTAPKRVIRDRDAE